MSKKNHPNRLPAYTKVTVSSLAAASAVGTTEAAVIYFDVNPDQTITASGTFNVIFGDINLDTGTYTLGSTAGDSLRFNIDTTKWERLDSLMQSAGSTWGYYAFNISYGDPINNTVFQDTTTPTEWGTVGSSLGEWNTGGSGYIGLRIDQGGGNFNYGWAHLDYTPAGAASSLTISGFAFQKDLNTSINAGAVPEPSTYALLALAGLFGAAVWHQRRHQRGAAPALLQLAAGARGVARFRANHNS